MSLLRRTRVLRAGHMQLAEHLQAQTYGISGKPKRHPEVSSEHGRLLHADALGLCNFLSMHYYYDCRAGLRTRAVALADDVHDVLGRARRVARVGAALDAALPRLGDACDADPLLGGLRCGRVMGENRPGGDGQVWYATVLWAFALNRLAVATDEPRHNELAAQLLVVSGMKFLTRALDDEGEGGGASGGEGVVKAAYALAPRMSVDLSENLPAKRRATDALVGALVCGVVSNALGPTGDAKIRQSLESMERQLVAIWKTDLASAERRAEIGADTMQIGDVLWAAAWTEQSRPWGKGLGEFALDATAAIVEGREGSAPLLEVPMALRNPVGELWMVAGTSSFNQGVLSQHANEEMVKLVKHLSFRLSMFGPLASVCTMDFSFPTPPHPPTHTSTSHRCTSVRLRWAVCSSRTGSRNARDTRSRLGIRRACTTSFRPTANTSTTEERGRRKRGGASRE